MLSLFRTHSTNFYTIESSKCPTSHENSSPIMKSVMKPEHILKRRRHSFSTTTVLTRHGHNTTTKMIKRVPQVHTPSYSKSITPRSIPNIVTPHIISPVAASQSSLQARRASIKSLRTPLNSAQSSIITSTPPLSLTKSLPILRNQYTVHCVEARIGRRWHIRKYVMQSIRLNTGSQPTLSLINLTHDTPIRVLSLPLDLTCHRTLDHTIKLQSQQDKSFFIRLRFSVATDAIVCQRAIETSITHARWLQDEESIVCFSQDHQSRVELVQHRRLKEQRVVKTLFHQQIDAKCSEVSILSKLFQIAQQPNVNCKALQWISCYRIIETETNVCIYMPRHPGKTLLSYLQEKPRPHTMSSVEAKMVIWGLCQQLDVLHRHGIFHCDIKLENILLTDVKNVSLIDYGGAYHKDNTNDRMIGTPGYIAPERIIHMDDPPTEGVDVFSLGIVLFQLLVGTHPFPPSIGKTLSLHVTQSFNWKYIHSQYQRRSVSMEAQNLIQQMLEPNPKMRISIQQIFEHAWFTTIDG